jgi:GNAT superfamily N-acetyltransferase
MSARLTIRRVRRLDFGAVAELLAAARMPVPASDRATLRRFRHLAADLGADFYLAARDGKVVGMVHVTYARQLGGAPRARIERLVIAPDHSQEGVAEALLNFAATRARKRSCATLTWTVTAGDLPPAGVELAAEGTEYVLHFKEKGR